ETMKITRRSGRSLAARASGPRYSHDSLDSRESLESAESLGSPESLDTLDSRESDDNHGNPGPPSEITIRQTTYDLNDSSATILGRALLVTRSSGCFETRDNR